MPTGSWLYSYLFIWTLILVQFAAIILLTRQVSGMMNHWVRNDPDWGLPLGSLAPELPDKDYYDKDIDKILGEGRKRIIFFLSSTCHTCDEAILRVWAISELPELEVVLAIQASDINLRLFLTKHGYVEPKTVTIIRDEKGLVAGAYKATVVPFVVVVSSMGRIAAKRTAITAAEISMLLRQADAFEAAT